MTNYGGASGYISPNLRGYLIDHYFFVILVSIQKYYQPISTPPPPVHKSI